jgi:glycosyltransferase involved in cell wall biosynthesis
VIHEKVVFITIGEPGYSRSWTYFNGARKLRANVEFIKVDSNNLIKQFLDLRKKLTKDYIYVVMSPSQYLVILVRLFLGHKIILDAGWSLFEGAVLARRKYGWMCWFAFKTYLIDFTSSHLSSKVILESNNQEKFYRKLFILSRRKTAVLYTGVDEESLSYEIGYPKLPDFFNNSKIVLFRGKYNRESGIEVLAATTKLLASEDITFWILCPGLPTHIEFSRHSYVNRTYIKSQSELSDIYKFAQVTVGQLAKNGRLNRTIPHKAFESAYLSKPYITADNNGIREIFEDKREIICTKAGDSNELAIKIRCLLANPDDAKLIGVNMNLKYLNSCSQELLAKAFLRLVATIE